MTSKLAKQLRNKVVAQYVAGLGSKKIFQALNISRSTKKIHHQNMERTGQNRKPTKAVHPNRQGGQGENDSKRPMVTLEQLQ